MNYTTMQCSNTRIRIMEYEIIVDVAIVMCTVIYKPLFLVTFYNNILLNQYSLITNKVTPLQEARHR